MIRRTATPHRTIEESTCEAFVRRKMMKTFNAIVTALAFGILLPASNCSAAVELISGLHNTGAGLADGAIDANYNLVGGNAVVRNSNDEPLPSPWVANTTTSKWISPAANGYQASQVFTWTMDEFFIPANAIPGSIKINGRWTSDNSADMYLNNNFVGSIPFEGYATLSAFSITNPLFFNTGAVGNVLKFVVNNVWVNGPSPTGLRVEFDHANSTYATPEPTTLLTWGILGLIGAGVAYRRKLA